MRVRSSVQSRFSLDMHTMVVSHASLQSSKEGQSQGGPCCGYFFITFQEGRPTGSYEGWEVV